MLVTKIFAAIAALTTTRNPIAKTSFINLHAQGGTSNLEGPADSMSGGSIVCAGLSCLDLQLIGCTQSGSEEAIERYDEAVHCAGGSASMTGTTLALLLRQNSKNNESVGKGDSVEKKESIDNNEEVHILTKIGPDFAGNTLLEFYRRAGATCDLIIVDDSARTSMAVLPVFQNGKRGCFVNLACNDGFMSQELLDQINKIDTKKPVRAFLFGYPHLLPNMQGKSLCNMLASVRQKLFKSDTSGGIGHSVLIGVDLNGVDGSDPAAAQSALIPALSEIDILHLNEDEAGVLSSSTPLSKDNSDSPTAVDAINQQMLSQIDYFHEKGCAVVLLSLGSKGAFVSVTPDEKRLSRCKNSQLSQWEPGTQIRIPAFKISHGDVNANGAGDALFSGFCLAASSWSCTTEKRLGDDGWKVSPDVAGKFASLVAWQRCDARTRDGNGMKSASQLMNLIYQKDLPDVMGA